MNNGTLAFLAWVWAHDPVVIILLTGLILLFALTVVDTHRHRKIEHRKRHMGNHLPH